MCFQPQSKGANLVEHNKYIECLKTYSKHLYSFELAIKVQINTYWFTKFWVRLINGVFCISNTWRNERQKSRCGL